MKNGWQLKKIGDVCSLMTGGTPSRANLEYFGGDIKWLVSGDINQVEIVDCEGRITGAGMKSSNAKLLPVNSVMIALNGQGKTRGTVALLRTRATCNQSLVSIYPNDPEKLMPEFLYANLHGRYQEIRQMTGDSGNERLAPPFAVLVPLQHEGARSMDGIPIVDDFLCDEAGRLDDGFADEPLPADLNSLSEPRDSVCHLGSPMTFNIVERSRLCPSDKP